MKFKCKFCLKNFYRNSLVQRKFCSHKHYLKFSLNKMIRNCKWCNKSFKARINRKGRQTFCSKKCVAHYFFGKNSRVFKTGFHKRYGYVLKLVGVGKYELYHRVKMEKAVGRKLTRNECVHHKNGKKDDNRLCNLQLISRSDHMRLHWKLRKKNA